MSTGLALVLDLLSTNSKPFDPIYFGRRLSLATIASVTLSRPLVKRAFLESTTAVTSSRNNSLKQSCVQCPRPKTYDIYIAPLFSPPPLRMIINTTLLFVFLDLFPKVMLARYIIPLVATESPYLLDEISSDLDLEFSTQIKVLANDLRQQMGYLFIHRIRRLVVAYSFSPRIAWKLLKDPSASAARKAKRKMSTLSYILRVTKTMIISKLTVMASSWAIRAGIRIGKHILSMAKSDIKVDWIGVLQNERTFYSPVACLTSLIIPALGTGIFSAIFRPKLGHWIGYRIGKFALKLNFRRRIGSAFLVRQIAVECWKWKSLPVNFCITGFPENVPTELHAQLPGCNIAISLSVFELQFIWLLAVHQSPQGSEDWEMLHNSIKMILAISGNGV